ncbi:ATP-binding protein [Papillibacter cinnamivorans]|uniref:AAA domain-containing protein n=1 Tax=Papillibacter cinnamivorans DSM 12816 TaxID=1122930 RepID=A0A1W2AN17_9FIRM|nr:ATP-binding protein [Papillibacter cinnamivorans]SMC62097.1 AAA domain-containing protein [Papillibacter cinnamivorans DSM 12816]
MDSNIARERLSYVVKADSITASQGDFLATHVAIRRLHLLNKFDIQPSGGRDYSEEAIYKKHILNSENKHQFIAVYGQSGTGKSHLIRWFEARFQQEKPENEVVLFIRRSDNTLKGTIRQLLEKSEVQGIANRDIYERLVRASVFVDENKLKDMIYHNFIIEIEHDDESHPIRITNVKRKRLEAFLNNEVVHNYLMSATGPIARMYSKIAEHTLVDRDTVAQFIADDFMVSTDLFEDIYRAGADPKAEKMARELMADESGAEDAKKIADYLNQFVNDVIQRCAGIEPGDFRQIFQEIRKELYRIGKNLTLFIEDVTSFTGVDDALLDALIVEHTGMNADDNICRIASIVGTTSNYLQNNFRDNHKDRITQYIYIPSDVFDEDGIFEFVGKYINTMSLPESTISVWLNNHAAPSEYPVHEVKEGANWEYVTIESGKQLCLYPFSKSSIRYLYKYGLTKGHQTPRYIIRDIIEPVVNDILSNVDKFPSLKYNIVNVNTTLSYRIHSQIKDEAQADRLLRFLSIWGDGNPDQYTQDGSTYIAAVKKEIIEELGLPILSLSEIQPPKPGPGSVFASTPELAPEPAPVPSPIPLKSQERVSKANAVLTNWSNGQIIDVSATVGITGILRAAQGDMCKFLFSSINWAAEGISMDNVSKVEHATPTLICFENQTKGTGFYTMPANWESVNLISAFIRWREYGNQSWNYPDSDLDAYLITAGLSRIKNDLVKAVNVNAFSKTSYIEAAIAAEMYRMILCGEYRERSLKNLTAKYLFEAKTAKPAKSSHSREWNSLVTILSQRGADVANRETVRQYFNLPQGGGSSVIVLDEPNLMRVFRNVKTNKLVIPEEDLQSQDTVKLRRDVFSYLKDIVDRIESVAKAELANALTVVQSIYDYFNNDEIDEDDILDLVTKSKEFYTEINNAQINVAVSSSDAVKKNTKQIAKAINDISEVLDEDDPLTILMTFSGDPLSDLQPLLDFLNQIDADIDKVDKQLISRKNALGDVVENEQSCSRYADELKALMVISTSLEGRQ